MTTGTDHTNRLAAETSPYLLQHRHNPVEWWPWNVAALAEAQRLGKPILLSVGYAACHWCHVMAHESFEDPVTAAVMNDLFVNIKVDREERPDIDQIYMAALHELGESGGWPLTMFLIPSGEPFWGGTYFPREARYGRPAFVDVLREVARVFHREPDKVRQNQTALVRKLAERARAQSPVTIGPEQLDSIARSIAKATDPVNGGLTGAPKFPQCAMLEYLWRAGHRSGDPRFTQTARLSLTRMSQGGIYDHLGGGYCRYSTDDRWLVPHFEKMLYDNAQILDLLALDHAVSRDPLFAARADETVGWLRREMTVEGGGLASSLDADSEGEEGRFYVWSGAELEAVLGADDAAYFAATYDVSDGGNFEGRNILNRLNRLDDTLEDEARLCMLRATLQHHRSKRVQPALDDKVLADWNGLAIAALAHASASFQRPDWLDDARRAFDFVAQQMTRGDRLGHSWRQDNLLFPGLASDFAAMTAGALALFEATAEHRFLDQAMRWQRALDRHYADPEHGGYYLTADDAEGLIVRPHATVDDAVPNHHGLIAQNLVRLAALTGDDAWRKSAEALFDAVLPQAAANPFGHLSLLNALDLFLHGAEIVVVGDGAEADRLLQTARSLPAAVRTVLYARGRDTLRGDHPVQTAFAAVTGAAAFVCRGQSCSLPVTDPDALRRLVLKPAKS